MFFLAAFTVTGVTAVAAGQNGAGGTQQSSPSQEEWARRVRLAQMMGVGQGQPAPQPPPSVNEMQGAVRSQALAELQGGNTNEQTQSSFNFLNTKRNLDDSRFTEPDAAATSEAYRRDLVLSNQDYHTRNVGRGVVNTRAVITGYKDLLNQAAKDEDRVTRNAAEIDKLANGLYKRMATERGDNFGYALAVTTPHGAVAAIIEAIFDDSQGKAKERSARLAMVDGLAVDRIKTLHAQNTMLIAEAAMLRQQAATMLAGTAQTVTADMDGLRSTTPGLQAQGGRAMTSEEVFTQERVRQLTADAARIAALGSQPPPENSSK